jgi:hypothetical protein
MTPNEQALVNRANAAEYLLARLISELLAQKPDPVAAGEAFLESVKEDLYYAIPARTKNPAKSDHLAGEVSSVAERIVGEALRRLRVAPGPSR